jgi:hypothetical protein
MDEPKLIVFTNSLTCDYAHRMRYTRAHAPILSITAAAGLRPRDMSRQPASSGPLMATPTLDTAGSRATYASGFAKHVRRKSVKVRRADISAPIPDSSAATPARTAKATRYTPMDSLLSPATSTKAGVLSEDDLAYQKEVAAAEIARIRQHRERERAQGTGSAPKRKALPPASPPSRVWTTDAETPTVRGDMESALSETPLVPPFPAHGHRRANADAYGGMRRQVSKARDENEFEARRGAETGDESERPPPTPEKPRGTLYAQRRVPQGTSTRKPVGKALKADPPRTLRPMQKELSNLTTGETTDGGREIRDMWGRAQGMGWS